METTHFKELLQIINYSNFDYIRNYILETKGIDLPILENVNNLPEKNAQLLNIHLSKIETSNFKTELEFNFYNANSIENKIIILKYYLNEIKKKSLVFELGLHLMEKIPIDDNGIENTSNLSEYEKYILKCQWTFNYIFEVIRELCLIIKVDYNNLLRDLKFELAINHSKNQKTFYYFPDVTSVDNYEMAENPEPKTPEKLVWLGTVAQFGFIINELVTKGFIQFPETHKELSISKLAQTCLNSFEIKTTKGSLENALNPEKSAYLPYVKQMLFTIPNINEVK